MTILHPDDLYHTAVQEVPGTSWVRSPHSAIHHIGSSVDDVAAASQALEDEGVPIEVCGCAGAVHPAGFAYHVTAEGLRIEVVRREVLAEMQALLAEEGR